MRLQIPMYDEVPVRLVHRLAYVQEQEEALAEIEQPGIAVFVDSGPLDMLHDEIRSPVFRYSAVV